jgi:glycosyltransferase involved in cell wall biosynthesis
MNMKKVLILAYDFPPYNSIGGQRPYAWFKYFKEFGYEPIVVTRHWDESINNPIDYIKPSKNQTASIEQHPEGIIYRAPFNPNLRDRLILKHGMNKHVLLRKVWSVFYMLFEFVIDKCDNKKTIHLLAQQAMKENKIDLIIATGEPFILFKYASALSKQFAVPWVADYRDGWSTNHNRSGIEKKYYSIIEKKIIATAWAVTAASKEFSNELQSFLKRKVQVSLNGYFHEKFNLSDSSVKQDKFIISFAGTLYPYQPIELFAKGFALFISKYNIDVVLKFIGVNFYPEQVNRIKQAFAGYEQLLDCTDRLAHDETIRLLNQSSVLLLPANEGYPQIYAKVFDYLALHKNILLFKSDGGTLHKIISETHSGLICNTAEEIALALEKMYVEWKKNGYVVCNSTGIEKYSRKNQTRLLVEKLNALMVE